MCKMKHHRDVFLLLLVVLSTMGLVVGMYTMAVPKDGVNHVQKRSLTGRLPVANKAASQGMMRSVASMQQSSLEDMAASLSSSHSRTETFRLSRHFQILRDVETQRSQWFLTVEEATTTMSHEAHSQKLIATFGETHVHILGNFYYRVLAEETLLETLLVSSSEPAKEDSVPIRHIEHVHVDYKLDDQLGFETSRQDKTSASPTMATGHRERHWACNGTQKSIAIPNAYRSMQKQDEEEAYDMVLGLIGGNATDTAALVLRWSRYYSTRSDMPRIEFAAITGLDSVVSVEVASGWTPTQIMSIARALAAEPRVYWVSKKPRHVLSNYFASSIGEGGHPLERTISKHGLAGKNMILGCVDTGIMVSHAFFNSVNNSAPQYILNTQLTSKPPPTNHKVSAYIYWSQSDTEDSLGGHGTHVTGTLAGLPRQDTTIYPYRGVAYDAQLVFFDIYDDRHPQDHLNIPLNMVNDMYAKMYMAGARVISNSWGSETHGYSLMSSFQADKSMYHYPGTLLVYAAGNDGTKGGSTINEPSSAKNVIAVGATDSSAGPTLLITTSDNQRLSGPLLPSTFGLPIAQNPIVGELARPRDGVDLCRTTSSTIAGKIAIVELPTCNAAQVAQYAQASGAICVLIVVPNSFEEGSFLPMRTTNASLIQIPVAGLFDSEYSSFPLFFQDGVSVSIEQTNMDINNVVYFSSRGPAYDGRIKPDVVAPGAMLLSSLSAPGYTFQEGLYALEGTSMATPIVSGLAVLLQEYFQTGYYPSGAANPADAMEPSGPLLKAMLINSARRMNGIVYLSPTQSSHVSLAEERYPFIYQGHGRVNVSNVMYFEKTSPFSLHVVKEASLATSQRDGYEVNVTRGQQLAVTLAYNDPPATAGAASALINVLYLTVSAPFIDNGTAYVGNNYDGSLTSPDLNNNVQKVIFKAPESGTYTIHVVAHSVPMDSPQKYAMVYTVGSFDDQGNFGPPVASSAHRDSPFKLSLLYSMALALLVVLWMGHVY